DGLNLDLIGSIPVPLLPLPEQQAIAAFLDRETGRIDALIAKKKNLLSLLAEQRTALISRAVTKGLNPSVKLKPSSVEWLGDVPEHWEVKKGKYLGVLQSTPNVDEEEQTEEGGLINYIKVDDLNSLDNIPFFKKSRLDCTIIKKPFVQNALIFPKRGAAIFTNKVSILLGKALLDPNMMGWKILKKYNLKYVYHTLLLRGLDDLADTSTVPQINNKHIYPEVFPLPPLPEQQAIAAFLDRETAKIDTLSAKVLTAIERLKEYRTALISAAVTGKIDVREAV
ncbi:MAG: restriction endonuclease subunit S, partial [Chlorobium sp.]